MVPKSALHIVSIGVLLVATACEKTSMTEPSNANAFAGMWVGVKRLVSCSSARGACAFQTLGGETYFSVLFTQEGDAVDGSVAFSAGGPLELPSGFFLRGQISPVGQLTFERYFTFDVGEPPYWGNFSIKRSFGRQLIGQMTGGPSGGDDRTLVWEILARPAIHR